MNTVKLYTFVGDLVTEVVVPPWKTPPELYVWGERFFLLREDGNYREARGSFWVPSQALPESPQEPQPVEGHPRATTDGEPPTEGLWESGAPKPIDPETGQHGAYYVLPEEERKKGFFRPVRETYIHTNCGAVTRMSREIAETYARDPSYYGKTFCVKCKEHLPVDQFVWERPSPTVRTDPNDWSGFERLGS